MPLAGQADLKLGDLKFSGGYLFSRVFVLPDEAYKSLHDKLKDYLFENVAASVEGETVFHAVAKVKDQKTVEALVTDVGGKILQIPDKDLTLRDFLEIINGEISSLKEELARLREELQYRLVEWIPPAAPAPGFHRLVEQVHPVRAQVFLHAPEARPGSLPCLVLS